MRCRFGNWQPILRAALVSSTKARIPIAMASTSTPAEPALQRNGDAFLESWRAVNATPGVCRSDVSAWVRVPFPFESSPLVAQFHPAHLANKRAASIAPPPPTPAQTPAPAPSPATAPTSPSVEGTTTNAPAGAGAGSGALTLAPSGSSASSSSSSSSSTGEAPVQQRIVSRPFNPAGFHFGKAKDAEVVVRVSLAAGSARITWRAGETALESESGTGAGATPGASASASASSPAPTSSANAPVPGAVAVPDGEHALLINVSPLLPGHSLFVPFLHEGRPQVASTDAVALTLELVALLADTRPDFCAGFNSLGAFASVNHLHVHTFFASEVFPAGKFPCEHAPRSEILVRAGPRGHVGPGSVSVRELEWYLPGFVFAIEGKGVVPTPALRSGLARAVGSCLESLIASDIPHHFFVADGGMTVYVIPRTRQRPVFGGRAQVALGEVCGLAIFTDASAMPRDVVEVESAAPGHAHGLGDAGADARSVLPPVTPEDFVGELRALKLDEAQYKEVLQAAVSGVVALAMS
jgi:hypothetical protein